jgi:hypothetical protein
LASVIDSQLRRRPLLFQERQLLAQFGVLPLQLADPRPVRPGDRLLRLAVHDPVPVHPAAQGAGVDPELARHRRDRPFALQHHADGFFLELGRELPATPRHVPTSSRLLSAYVADCLEITVAHREIIAITVG